MSNTSYDLIAINNVSAPDIQKGTLTVLPNPKYNEYEGEEGNKVIEEISTDKIKGTVTYSGLFQSQIQTICAALSLVSTMTIYNPMTGTTRTFKALILVGEVTKIIHDGTANAWAFSFEFEEVDYVNA